MRKKIFFMFITTMVMAILSGCGETTGTDETTESESIESETTSGTVSLTVWGADEDAPLLAEIVTRFEAKYPNNKFNITIAAHSESECRDGVLGDINNAPDVFTFADDQFDSFVASGVLKSIPDSSDVKSRNLDSTVVAASMKDNMYAYPLTADNGYFLFYNKKYLSEDDVATMDGLLAKAGSLDKGVTFDATSGWYAYSFFGNTGMSMGLNDDGISNHCDWNSTDTAIKGVDVAQAMLDLYNNPAMRCLGDDGLVEGAKNDTIVAGVSGVWLASQLQEAWGNNLAATKLPTYTVNGQQVQLASYAGYKMVGVNSYSDNVDWAYKFADFMTSVECQTLRFEMRQQGPSNKNASQNPAVAASVSIQALLKQSEFSSLQRVGGAYWGAMGDFGNIMVNHNPDNIDLQKLMDNLVIGITSAN